MSSNKRGLNYRRHLKRVFLACLTTYQEARINNSAHSCAALYDAIGRNFGARPTYSRRVVRATASDFIADFELAAMRVLDAMELAYFRLVFVQGRTEIDDALQAAWPAKRYGRFCNKLAEKMGHALKLRGLFPMAKYFQPTLICNKRSWPSGDCEGLGAA